MAIQLIDRALRMGEGRKFKAYEKRVESINRIEPEMKELEDNELLEEANALRERAKNGEALDDLLPESFALTREAAWRALGQRPWKNALIFIVLMCNSKVHGAVHCKKHWRNFVRGLRGS